MPAFPTDYSRRSIALAATTPGWRDLVLRASRLWLILGIALLLLVPTLATAHGPFGWWPFWLVVAPLTNLIAWTRRT